MKRFDLINYLIKQNDYKSYLEIGVFWGLNYLAIECESKTAVDPKPYRRANKFVNHKVTSDEFFSYNKDTFDIVFIDGLHLSEQVYRDITNSLDVLNDGGTIVCHDMSPTEEGMQLRDKRPKVWTGDCWKAWVDLRQKREDLTMFVVNTDMGCGVIQKGSQETLKTDKEINYHNMDENRKEWLNLISIDEFKELV